jgi:uncharacterized SAM-binding protein YcdF (DUF218 family)
MIRDMGIEARPGKFIRDSAIGAGAAFAVGLPVVNYENTSRAISALKGRKVDYVGVGDLESGKYTFGAIAVPGAGSNVLSEGIYEPNGHGRIRLEGAAIAYAMGAAPIIILLHGEGHPNIAESNRDYLQAMYAKHRTRTGNIPEWLIIDEATSINTSQDMEQLSKMREEYGNKPVLIVTSNFHTNRAALLARAHGVTAGTIAAEDLVLSRDPHRAPEIDDLYGTPEMAYLKRKEKIEIAGSIWDPRARAWTALRELDNVLRRFTQRVKVNSKISAGV